MERTFTKDDVEQIIAPLLNIVAMRHQDVISPAKFHVPLTRTTSVEVKFHGPVGVDEYDAFLAHIAFYKQLVPKEGEEPIDGRPLIDQVRDTFKAVGLLPKPEAEGA